MAKKLDAEAISMAIEELEKNSRTAAFTEIRDELRDWADGAWIGKGETREVLEELLPGLRAVLDFIESNYSLND